MLYLKRLFMVLLASIAIAGCSSSSSGPGTATVTAENSKDLAVAATEAVKSSSATESVSFGFKTGGSIDSISADSLTKRIAEAFYVTEDLSMFCDNPTGIYIIESDENAGTASVTISDCDIDEATLNGSMSITSNSNSLTVSASLTVTTGSEIERLSFNGTCAFNNGEVGECSFTTSFSGIDGRTYTTVDMSVTGNESSGYTVSGTVTDPTHGVITINTTTPVTYGACTRGNPVSGVVVVTGDVSATVTYIDCDTFSVTLNGVVTTYNWADI